MKKTELYSKFYVKLERICKKTINNHSKIVYIIEKTFNDFLMFSFHKSHKERVWMQILYELMRKNIDLERCFTMN